MKHYQYFEENKMSPGKRKKLIHHVFNIMSRKNKGRNKKPAMTKKWGVVRKGFLK